MSRILVLCTGNSCRSQMAEGFLRKLGADVKSAGTEARGLDPMAVQVMSEVGVDITDHESKTFERFLDTEFDYVVTVCDDAEKNCPYFPGEVKRLHQAFQDPVKYEGSAQERLKVFREVRDQIKTWSRDWYNSL